MSPEKLSYVAWNFITLNNILASLLHIYCASFVSSKIKEQDILLIYRATFVVHQGLTSGIITHDIPLISSHHSSLKRGMLHIHSTCFVSWWFKEREIIHTLFIWQELTLFLFALHLINLGDMTQHFGRLNSGFRRHNFGGDDFRATWPVTTATELNLRKLWLSEPRFKSWAATQTKTLKINFQ